ncbi:hypothetical protein FKM82_013255 [Ascaphus truei]
MQALWTKPLCILILIHLCHCVIVKDEDLYFPLEAIKKLKVILDQKATMSDSAVKAIPHKNIAALATVCTHPELPKEFVPVCEGPSAMAVFARLEQIADNIDQCDVCAYAACSGCP